MTALEALSEHYAKHFTGDAARALEALPSQDIAAFLDDVAPGLAADLLAALSPPIAAEAVLALDPAPAADILSRVPVAAMARLLRCLPRASAERLLAALPDTDAERARRMLAYPPRCAGALMDPSPLAISARADVAAAIELVRRRRSELDHYLHVIDDHRVLVGVVRVVDLMVSGPATALADIMTRDPRRLRDDDAMASVLAHTGWQTWRSLPVVSSDGALVGVLRYQAVRGASLEDLPGTAGASSALSLALSLAELLWLGAAGVAEGIARSAVSEDDHVR